MNRRDLLKAISVAVAGEAVASGHGASPVLALVESPVALAVIEVPGPLSADMAERLHALGSDALAKAFPGVPVVVFGEGVRVTFLDREGRAVERRIDAASDDDAAREQLQARATEAEHRLEGLCNQLANIGDTTRVRGFGGRVPIDERVIAMAQALDVAQKRLELGLGALRETADLPCRFAPTRSTQLTCQQDPPPGGPCERCRARQALAAIAAVPV